MKYVNSDTGVEIELTGLTDEKTKLYRQALEKFRKNVDWITPLARGGKRTGAGRPPTGQTPREIVTWRLPVDLLVRLRAHARLERLPVTTWVERRLLEALRSLPASASAAKRGANDRG